MGNVFIPQFRPNRAPRNCKISWVTPGEGNPQGGGGIPPLWGGEPSQTVAGVFRIPHPPRHSVALPSYGGELYRPIPPQSGPAKLQNFVGDTWGGEPAGWRGYHHPPRRFAPPLRGRGITLDFSHVFDTL